jgi:hypothetical protein
MLLPCSHERQADTPATMLRANSQPIHVPPPAVPRGDQRTQNGTVGVGVGDKQAARCPCEQPLHILQPVSSARMLAPGLLPKLKDDRPLLWQARANNETPLGQAATIADARLVGNRGYLA